MIKLLQMLHITILSAINYCYQKSDLSSLFLYIISQRHQYSKNQKINKTKTIN